MEYAESHVSKYFLSDIRKQGIVSPKDRKWFQEFVVPRAKECGFIKAAAISDEDSFKLYCLNLIVKYTSAKSLPTRLFKAADDAVKWFLEN